MPSLPARATDMRLHHAARFSNSSSPIHRRSATEPPMDRRAHASCPSSSCRQRRPRLPVGPPLAAQMSSDNRRLRGQAFPVRSGAGTSRNVGKCSSALSSSICIRHHPDTFVSLTRARTASPLPCSFAATLPRAPTQAPLPDFGFSSTCVTVAGTGHHPGRQSPSPVRISLRPIGHVA